MKGKIIHIAIDEKFINSAYKQFERASPDNNRFYIITPAEDVPLKHVVPAEHIRTSTVKSFVKLYNPSIRPDDLVIFHSLAEGFYPIVFNLIKEVKCIWLCYGYEIYNDPYFYRQSKVLAPITKSETLEKDMSFQHRTRHAVRPLLRLINKDLQQSVYEKKMAAIKRMNFLGSSFYEEFEQIQRLTRQKKEFFPFWYYPIDDIVVIGESLAPSRADILIGNSANETNNHLDVFDDLKKIDFKGRKLIVPLSYGPLHYRKKVIDAGTVLFPDSFHPLTDFMPLDLYNETLKKCGVALFNCRRQQAVGNIISLIWFGSKVFVSTKNTFYQYLKRLGVIIFSYEDDLDSISINKMLTLDEIEHNRKILYENLNTDTLHLELRQFLQKHVSNR